MRPWLRWGISWWGCMLLRRCCITMCFGITRWCGCCRGGGEASAGGRDLGRASPSANAGCRRPSSRDDGVGSEEAHRGRQLPARSIRSNYRSRAVIQCRSERPAQYFAQIPSTVGLEGQINESPLSFSLGRIARFARFEGRCISWCCFVITAALIRFPC